MKPHEAVETFGWTFSDSFMFPQVHLYWLLAKGNVHFWNHQFTLEEHWGEEINVQFKKSKVEWSITKQNFVVKYSFKAICDRKTAISQLQMCTNAKWPKQEEGILCFLTHCDHQKHCYTPHLPSINLFFFPVFLFLAALTPLCPLMNWTVCYVLLPPSLLSISLLTQVAPNSCQLLWTKAFTQEFCRQLPHLTQCQSNVCISITCCASLKLSMKHL